MSYMLRIPYTTLFRTNHRLAGAHQLPVQDHRPVGRLGRGGSGERIDPAHRSANIDNGSVNPTFHTPARSEEHTSELQSHVNLVCRLLLEKKKTKEKSI